MNSSQTQNRGLQSARCRVAVTLSLSLLVFFTLLPATAQVRTPKRITSVWTATTAEGSRVHVVSDSPVNDYEGYTRGGRFYVKIPLADLPTARGSLLGRGFDDVQIQRYGDGIIISFRLQPGTSARVEQAANQLEVVFTTPGGSRSAVAGARDIDEATRTRARRTSDSAGPSPTTMPLSSGGSRSERRPSGPRHVRSVSESVRRPTTGTSARNSNTSGNQGSKPSQGNQNSSSAESSTPTRPSERTPSPSPSLHSSPTPATSPTTTPSGLSASASPVSSPASVATPRASQAASQASSQVSPASTLYNATSTQKSDWKSRAHYWKVWAELNWVPITVGVVIALAVLVLLFFWRAAKRGRGDEADRAESTPAQSEKAPVASPSPGSEAAQSVSAAPVATGRTQSPAADKTHSTIATPSEHVKPQGEEQEREVFEL
jgi:hypothetical protein